MKILGRKLNEEGNIVNDPNEQGLCLCCNKSKQQRETKIRKDGSFSYKAHCSHCLDVKREYSRDRFKGSKSYRKNVKSSCERCGFIPEHICQLDVDHIDNNHNNDEESNLQTLCANCHRLKTQNHKEIGKEERKKFVLDYFNNESLVEAKVRILKENTKVVRRTIDYIQYKVRVPINSTEYEINNSFLDEIERAIIRHGLDGQEKRRNDMKLRLERNKK